MTAVTLISPNSAFLNALRPALNTAAIPDKAVGMAAYMKSSMPFLGTPSPAVRKTVRSLMRHHPFASVEQLAATASLLWERAEFREERYAAIMLTDSRLGRGEPVLLTFYEAVIGMGQWWDFVDSVAPRMWDLLRLHPVPTAALIREWSVHRNFWFRRAAIISQLPAKAATDTQLLKDVIEPNLADGEFFIRKAIGWSLRQYARTDPDWVRRYVGTHEARLSPLSRREALKHL